MTPFLNFKFATNLNSCAFLILAPASDPSRSLRTRDAGYSTVLTFDFVVARRLHSSIEAVHRPRDTLRHDHFHRFGAQLDFLGDQVLFVAANLAQHVFPEIAAELSALKQHIADQESRCKT